MKDSTNRPSSEGGSLSPDPKEHNEDRLSPDAGRAFTEETVKRFFLCRDALSSYYGDEDRGTEAAFQAVLAALFLHYAKSLAIRPEPSLCSLCPLPRMAEEGERDPVCAFCMCSAGCATDQGWKASPLQEAAAELDRFFDDYSFSVSEGSPRCSRDVIDLSAIASVCESLTGMDSSSGGVVYTPRAEIELMCRLALADNLAGAAEIGQGDLIYRLIFAGDEDEKSEIDSTIAGLGLWKPLVERLMSLRICDPSCGGASFLTAMLSMLDDLCRRGLVQSGESYYRQTIRRQIIEQSLYGVDINRWACRFAVLRLCLSRFEGLSRRLSQPEGGSNELQQREKPGAFLHNIHCFDSLLLPCLRHHQCPPEPSSESDKDSWNSRFPEIFRREAPGFDIVLGNPPYVRQEMLVSRPGRALQAGDYKQQIARLIYDRFSDFFGNRNSDKQRGRQAGPSIDRRSDLYIYFYFLGFSLLRDGGSLSFLSSRSWLEVSYGRVLREFLFRRARLSTIIENEMHRTFASAFINTVIVNASAEHRIEPDSTSSFIMLRMPFEDAISSSLFKKQRVEDEEGDSYRIISIRQSDLFGTAENLSEDNRLSLNPIEPAEATAERGRLHVKSGSLNDRPRFQSGFLPRVPEIYRTITEKGRGIMLPLGSFTSLMRGMTTGANDFFYLDRESRLKWEIEEEYLKPVIKSPRECRKILIHAENHSQKAFICHKDRDELEGTGALEYIRHGEKQSIQMRPSLKGKNRWWELRSGGEVTHLWQKSVDRRHIQCQLIGSAAVDQRLYRLCFRKSPYALTAVLNSAVTILFREVAGRVSLGEGALDSAVYEALSLPVVDPLRLDEKASREAVEALSLREIRAIDEEFEMDDRSMLDGPVFDLLSLTKGERDAVYEAVCSLVESRLTRAGTFRRPRKLRHR